MTSLHTAKRRVLFRQNAKDLVSTESLELGRSDEGVSFFRCKNCNKFNNLKETKFQVRYWPLLHTVVTPNKATPNKAIFTLFALKSENVQIRQCLV